MMIKTCLNRKPRPIFFILAIILFISASDVFSQFNYGDTTIVVLDSLVGVRIDKGQEGMHADVHNLVLDENQQGSYRIFIRCIYAGDQDNESLFLSVKNSVNSDSLPLDPNLGHYKVVVDDRIPGPHHTNWRDGGLFNLYQGNNLIKMHHYATISEEYPFFLYDTLSPPESVEIEDSLVIIAYPDFSHKFDVTKSDIFIDNDNDEQLSINDLINYEISITNSGVGTAHNCTFIDTIPDGASIINGSVTSSKGTIVSTSPILEVYIGSIAPKSSETVSINFQMRLETSFDSIKNQGYLDCSELDAHPTDDPETDKINDPTITSLPKFTGETDVLKRVSFQDMDRSESISSGDLINYTVTLKNSGFETANNVVFSDTIPQYTTLVGNSITTTKGTILSTSPIINVAIGDVLPQELEIVTIQFQLQVTDSVQSLENQGYIDCDQTRPHPTDDPETDELDDPTKLILPRFKGINDVIKSDSFQDVDNNGGISSGDLIRYAVQIQNSGNGVATNVAFSDTIPQNTKYVPGSGTTTKGTISSTTPVFRVEIGNIAPNNSEQVEISFQVEVTAEVDSIFNQGFVDCDQLEPNETDDPETEEENDKTITYAPNFRNDDDFIKRDVFFDTDNDGTISAGDSITYLITIKNSGKGVAHNVVFTDSIPQNTTYVAGSATTSKGEIVSTSPVFKINIGTIAPNQSETINISFKVIVTAAANYVANQALLDSDESSGTGSDDPDTRDINDKTITKLPSFSKIDDLLKTDVFADSDDNNSISPNDLISYTVTIKNSGLDTARNIAFTDTIPEHTTLVENSISTSKGTIVSTSPVLVINIGSVAPEESEIITIEFQVMVNDSVLSIENQGYISDSFNHNYPTDDPDTEVEDDKTITALPRFQDNTDVLKSDSFRDIDNDGTLSTGDLITYNISITNSGIGQATQVVFSDTLPSQVEYVTGSASTSKGTILNTDPIFSVNIGTLFPSESVLISFQVRIVANVDSVINQGYINCKETDPHPTDDPETMIENDETITFAPDFSGDSDITKQDTFFDTNLDGKISAGDSIFYLIKIKNSGKGIAHNVVFSDSIPNNTVYAEGSAITSKGTIGSTTPVLVVNIGSIAPLNSEIVEVSFKVVVVNSTDQILNQGNIDADESKGHKTNDPDTPEIDDKTITRLPSFDKPDDVLKADTFYDNDDSDSITSGDVISYTVTIKNSGSGIAYNTVFTDTIPEYTTYLDGSLSTSKGTIVSADSVIRVEIDQILPDEKEKVTIRFSVTIIQATTVVSNQGFVIADDLILEPTDDPDTEEENDETVTSLPSFSGITDLTKTYQFNDVDSDQRLSPNDIITYQITVQNSGKGVAHNVTVVDTIPGNTAYVDGSATTSKGSISTTTPILRVVIGDLAPNSSETVLISFQVRITDYVYQIANQGFLNSDENEHVPTDDPESEKIDDRTIITNDDLLSDISLIQFAVTDSFIIEGSDTTKFAESDETYDIYIKVQNISTYKADNVVVNNLVADSLNIISYNREPYHMNLDTLIWHFSSLAPDSFVIIKLQVKVPEIMPLNTNQLPNRVLASCSNEDSTKLGNNSSTEIVYNVGKPLPIYQPEINATPPEIDVTDSIAVSVKVPQYNKNWDIWVYLPDGNIDKQFGDNFIQSNTLISDQWYTLDTLFKPIYLMTTDRQESVIFEIRTTDIQGQEAQAQASVIVHSSNYLVLDRNVFKPEVENALGIRFKLSSRRNAKLDVYDIAGRHITKVTEDVYQGGWNLYYWDGNTESGLKVGSGVYIVTLRSGEFSDWKKFIIVR